MLLQLSDYTATYCFDVLVPGVGLEPTLPFPEKGF